MENLEEALVILNKVRKSMYEASIEFIASSVFGAYESDLGEDGCYQKHADDLNDRVKEIDNLIDTIKITKPQ